VRVSLFPATLVALATLFCLADSGLSQEGARPSAAAAPVKTTAVPPSGTNVAVIDVGFIFKNHIRFNSSMKQLEQEMEEYQGWMKSKEATFKELRDALGTFKAGTVEFQKQEEKIANETAQTQLDIRRKQQELAAKEAGLYYDTYAELEQKIGLVAQRNRIGIVLRYNREPMKRDDRSSVLQGINRAVVYQYGLDITKYILDEVNKDAPAPTTGTANQRNAAPVGPTKSR
jgi:Skp family chaperone for outer membrane proteins